MNWIPCGMNTLLIRRQPNVVDVLNIRSHPGVRSFMAVGNIPLPGVATSMNVAG